MTVKPLDPAAVGLRFRRPDCGFREPDGRCKIFRRIPRLTQCLGCEARRVPREVHGGGR